MDSKLASCALDFTFILVSAKTNVSAWVPTNNMQAAAKSVFHSKYGCILHHFGDKDKARYWSKIVIFSYPFAFEFRRPVRGVPVGIAP